MLSDLKRIAQLSRSRRVPRPHCRARNERPPPIPPAAEARCLASTRAAAVGTGLSPSGLSSDRLNRLFFPAGARRRHVRVSRGLALHVRSGRRRII